MSDDLAPFQLIETSAGKYSLLLTQFAPASDAFEAVGSEGGGYAWAGIAGHIVAQTPGLAGRLRFDPESSMFCAYGTDREALAELGGRLAQLFHDRGALAAVIAAVGPEALDD